MSNISAPDIAILDLTQQFSQLSVSDYIRKPEEVGTMLKTYRCFLSMPTEEQFRIGLAGPHVHALDLSNTSVSSLTIDIVVELFPRLTSLRLRAKDLTEDLIKTLNQHDLQNNRLANGMRIRINGTIEFRQVR